MSASPLEDQHAEVRFHQVYPGEPYRAMRQGTGRNMGGLKAALHPAWMMAPSTEVDIAFSPRASSSIYFRYFLRPCAIRVELHTAGWEGLLDTQARVP